MSTFVIDNRRIDKRIYAVECSDCATCSNKEFYKDEYGAPFYFAALSPATAVIFCSAKCSSDWYQINKEKVWDKKVK